MKISRRLLLSAALLLPLMGTGACSAAKPSDLITVTDLSSLAQEAEAMRLPILLFATAPNCRYCHQLERDVIQPMLKNKQYQQKVLMRRLDLGQDTIVDFDGQTKDIMLVAKRYKAQLTPTIVFLAPRGEIVEDHILGVVADIDQYGGMIDARLNSALTKLGNSARIVH
jgi:thioredoxin-related protein